MNLLTSKPAAFDAWAGDYDDIFTHAALGKLLRARVWEELARRFSSGQHILELACGTGEDAIWLAQKGVRVTATDGSAKMVEVAKAKAEAAGLTNEIAFKQISLQRAIEEFMKPLRSEGGGGRGGSTGQPSNSDAAPGPLFDGVFSNFGGLNTIGDWRPLAKALAKLVKSGGKLILVPMGPFCPWEIIWHLAHGQPQVAFRRLGRRATAKIGEAIIPVWYPSANRLRADFAPWFNHLGTESLGLWLPPSYLNHLVKRWPNLFSQLDRFERMNAPLTKGWGDHYIIVLESK
jgi:SAM-dependent methyltransferase